MDITNLFKASVKTVKLRNKALVGISTKKESRENELELSEKCPFSSRSREIVRTTTELRDFLCKNRKAYLNLNNLWSGGGMTDLDRDTIDSETEAVIKATGQLLSNLKKSLAVEYRGRSSSQVYSHRKAIIEIVSAYLKAVCKIYGEQRAVRVKKASDMKRMSRLESLVRASKMHNKPKDVLSPDGITENHQSSSFVSDSPLIHNDEITGLRHRKHSSGPDAVKQDNKKQDGFLFDWETVATGSNIDQEISYEEAAQLTKENDQLYHKMNAMVDEIQQLEGKVVEISKLQEVFTEKVLEQESDIYRINEVAIHTTENIKSGNEQIREAMKKKATMRVYILFFLIVLSFTLLFLDWYNS